MYTVNIVPVLAKAIIVYEVNSTTRDTLAVLRSRRGEEGSSFLTVIIEVRPRAPAFGRAEGYVLAVPPVPAAAILCGEVALECEVDEAGPTRGLCGTSGSSVAGGRGGVESWTGDVNLLLNKEIIAGQRGQR